MAAESPLQNAESLWKMLDDMAENDPEGYKTFMDKMLKGNKDWLNLKPPEPVFSMRTLKLPESSNHSIFINICKWDKVAIPKDTDDRISVVANELRDIPDCTSKHSVIDLCFHSEIFKETLISNINHCSKIMAPMALDYVESKEGIKLSRSFKVLTIKYKGDVKDLTKFVLPTGDTRPPPKPTGNPSVFHGLSNIVEQRTKDDSNQGGLLGDFKVKENQKPKKPLIEEVSAATMKSKTPPKYQTEIADAISGPKCIVVVVDLPKVKTGAECQLDVSKDDLLLCSPYNADLNITLPDKGNEDKTTSTFDKTTHQLTITIPVISK